MEELKKVINMDNERKEPKLVSWILEYADKEKIRNEKLSEMFASASYLEWLSEFTLMYPSFTDDSFLITSLRASEEEIEKVQDLELLYLGVDEYARGNYLYPCKNEFGNFYKIRLGEIGYEIGITTGKKAIFFCNRVPINEEKNDFLVKLKISQYDGNKIPPRRVSRGGRGDVPRSGYAA